MVQPTCVPEIEQVVDTMIALTGPSKSHRVVIAGNNSMMLHVSLRRCGFIGISTPKDLHHSGRQHSVGLIAGQNSLPTIETALTQVTSFFSNIAVIAILIDSQDGEFCLKIGRKLRQTGFRVEAGARCRKGLVLCASAQRLA